MKKKETKQPKTPLPQPEKELPAELGEEIIDLHQLQIPPGVALNDIFLDSQEMCDQLHICKRALNNMKKSGDLSSTQLIKNGKVYFLKQEVAATLKQNIVIGKNSALLKNGLKCINASIGLFSMGSFDAAELVNMLMFA